MEGVIFSGSSAGCFPATLLALDVDVKHFFFNENIPLIMEAQEVSYSGLGSWNALVRKNMLNSLHQHAYKKANKRLYFSLTQVPYMRNELVTTWDHNEDMVDCMLSSAFVPIYAKSFVSRFRGKKYLDGSLTNNSPVAFPEHPHKVFQIWKWRWILPNWIPISTNPEWAMEQFRMGREDAMKNLHEIEEVFFS
jgi:predicted acylesterase/phospholipase RssA